MSEVVSYVVKAGESQEVDVPEGCVVQLNNAAIRGAADGKSAQVFVEVEGEKVLVCTLIAGRIPQYSMDVVLQPSFSLPSDDEEDEKEDEKEEEKEDEDKEEDEDDEIALVMPKIIVEGEGEVHLCGVLMDNSYGEDEDEDDYDDDEDEDPDMDDEDEDEEDEEEEPEEPAPKKAKVETPNKEQPKPATPKKEQPKPQSPKAQSPKAQSPKKPQTPKKN